MHAVDSGIDCNLSVGDTIYITEHRHKAVYGDENSIKYGELEVNSYVYGKNVGLTADNKLFADSTKGTNLGINTFVLNLVLMLLTILVLVVVLVLKLYLKMEIH